MADDVALDGKVSNIDLDLSGNYQAIFCVGPLNPINHCVADEGSACLTCV